MSKIVHHPCDANCGKCKYKVFTYHSLSAILYEVFYDEMKDNRASLVHCDLWEPVDLMLIVIFRNI